MMNELTKDEFVERLLEAGWQKDEAEDEYEKMMKEAELEDGM